MQFSLSTALTCSLFVLASPTPGIMQKKKRLNVFTCNYLLSSFVQYARNVVAHLERTARMLVKHKETFQVLASKRAKNENRRVKDTDSENRGNARHHKTYRSYTHIPETPFSRHDVACPQMQKEMEASWKKIKKRSALTEVKVHIDAAETVILEQQQQIGMQKRLCDPSTQIIGERDQRGRPP